MDTTPTLMINDVDVSMSVLFQFPCLMSVLFRVYVRVRYVKTQPRKQNNYHEVKEGKK